MLLVEGAAVAVMRCQYSWGCHAWMRSYRVCCCHLFILLSVLAQRFCHHVSVWEPSKPHFTGLFHPFHPRGSHSSKPKWVWVNTYRSIFSGLFTSINPSYFGVHGMVPGFWPIPKLQQDWDGSKSSCPGGSSRVIPLSGVLKPAPCRSTFPFGSIYQHISTIFFVSAKTQTRKMTQA